MKKLLVGLLMLGTFSIFASDVDPCGLAYSTETRFSLYRNNADGSIHALDPILASRIENVLNKRNYKIVKPEQATYVLNVMVTDTASITKVDEFYLYVYKKNTPILAKSALIDAWPVGVPDFVVRNRIVSWVKKLPYCE